VVKEFGGRERKLNAILKLGSTSSSNAKNRLSNTSASSRKGKREMAKIRKRGQGTKSLEKKGWGGQFEQFEKNR